MVIKRATPFTHIRSPAYTRKSKKRELNFIRGYLPIKIQKFDMGNVDAFNEGRFDYFVWVKSKDSVQIRDNAIEACRKQILRNLEKKVGKNNFYFKVVKYPHQVLRENKMLTGAGADRLQTGMQLAFGTPVGNAAVVKQNESIFFIATTKEFINTVKDICNTIKSKLPCSTKIEIEKK